MIYERDYPDDMSRFDDLLDKSLLGTLSFEEKIEFNSMDKAIMKELNRIILHYRVNWNFMTDDVKAKYRADLEEYRDSLKKPVEVDNR